MTYSGEGVTVAALESLVKDELGEKLVFVPKKADDQFRVDLHDVAAADLLHALSRVGAAALVHSADRDGAPVRFSLKAWNIPAGTVAMLLKQLFGDAVSVQSGDPDALISLDVENATLRDLRDALPKATGVRVRDASPAY